MGELRVVLHSDMNCFYASVEQAERPELRGLPVIVGGNEQNRHGIVLTASYEAKRAGVKTAMALWEARRACPQAIIVAPRYDLYMRYSQLARRIYYQYTDLVESFGLDECWLDLTHSLHLHGGDALLVAREISERMRQELGVTVSIGVSWNKIFAKFGSDHDKPDGLMQITPHNACDIVWPAPVDELLYVGPATARKLRNMGVHTIGQLAMTDQTILKRTLGKMGLVIWRFALGQDDSPVRPLTPTQWENERLVKSVGNAITLPFDVDDERTARQVIWLLGESVAQRLRAHGLRARTIGVNKRDAKSLLTSSRQMTLERPSFITRELCHAASKLFLQEYNIVREPVRAMGVRASNLVPARTETQLDLLGEVHTRRRAEALDCAIDELRSRFGNASVRRLGELVDKRLTDLDPERDNVIHPVSYFG